MQIILTEDVVGVGDIGETIRVKPGFARNYLIPRGLAVEANAASARKAAHQARLIEAKKAKLRSAAEELSQRLSAATVITELRVGVGGKVFGSITARDLADQLTALGFDIDRRRILLPEPIKKLGTQEVRVKLHPDVISRVKVTVNARGASQEEVEQEVEEARTHMEERAAAASDEARDAVEIEIEELQSEDE